MKKLDLKLLLVISLISFSSFSQSKKQLWIKSTKQQTIKSKKTPRKSQPKKSSFFQLDIDNLKLQLQSAKKSNYNSKAPQSNIIKFPNSDGTLESYSIRESSIMTADFQSKHKNIRSYIGQSIENPESTIYFSITPQGLHSMKLSTKNGAQFIDPYTTDSKTYITYNKKDLSKPSDIFKCHLPENNTVLKTDGIKRSSNAQDGKLRTFRLALASTVEYSDFHITAAGLNSGTDTQKKDAVLAAMVVTMTRVNGIFKRDLSIQMTLVDNEDIIFLVENDGLSNNDANALINESQTVIDNAILSSNYDIGHTFSTGAGGVAVLSSVCTTNSKAKGVTGLATPVGDAFDVDFVAHELGHQFGAPHTWNGSSANCVLGEWTSSNAYEPGSGSTIMGYAGICSPQNVQASSDAYFHQKSLQMMWDNIISGNSTCANASATNTGNSVPTAEAGSSFTIPISTPYKLTGSSSDLENTNTHTFTWEQYDLGGSRGLPTETEINGPLVRSFEGTTTPIRYVPRLEDLRTSGGSTTWEKLTSVNRDINFRLTVRDNDTRGGQTATDIMTITTNNSGGPFIITSQNTSGISWETGSTQNITWNVANTNLSPFNVSNVNILLSTDGGLTYPTTLASNVPNTGTYQISSVPNIPAPYCRIMIEAVGNIFFAINSEDFAIGYTVTTTCNQQFSSGPVNIDIISNQQFTNVLNIPSNGIISSLKVNIDATHSYIGDLTFRLTHPDNSTQSIIWNENCFGNQHINLDVIFEDNTNPVVCASPTTGNYNPDNPLSIFNGLQSSGNWELSVSDGFDGDNGTLNDWYLDFCLTTVTLGDSSNTNNAFDNFKVYPNPNKGEFTVKLNNTESKNINIEVYDIRGRSIFKSDYQTENDFNELINLNHAQSGLYILNISNGKRKLSRKIIIN